MRKYRSGMLMLILIYSLNLTAVATEVAGKCGVIESDAVEIQHLEEEMQEKLYQAVRNTQGMDEDEVMPLYAETLIHLDGAVKIYDGSNILFLGSIGMEETETELENSGYMWMYQTVYDRVLYEVPVIKNGEGWNVSEVRVTEGGARYINKAAAILEAAGCYQEDGRILLCENLPYINGIAALAGTEQTEYLIPLEGTALEETDFKREEVLADASQPGQEFFNYEAFMEAVNGIIAGDLTEKSAETVEMVTTDYETGTAEAEQTNSAGMTWILIGMACIITIVVILLFVWDRKRAKEM